MHPETKKPLPQPVGKRPALSVSAKSIDGRWVVSDYPKQPQLGTMVLAWNLACAGFGLEVARCWWHLVTSHSGYLIVISVAQLILLTNISLHVSLPGPASK